MSYSRKRRAAVSPASVSASALEARRLLAASGVWIGQDGHDLVGPSSTPGADGVQDIHISLTGLPTDKSVVSVDVLGYGGGEWAMNPKSGSSPWAAALARTQGSASADLYIDPYQVETGRRFSVELDYNDGTLEYVWLDGGVADPNLRMPNAALSIGWVGQTNVDMTGVGPNVGPDNKVDAQITLSNLSTSNAITSVVLKSSEGTTWTYGTNPSLSNSAELILRNSDSSKADFYFQPTQNLAGQSLSLFLVYANGKTDSSTLIAGAANPSLSVTTPAPIVLNWGTMSAQWTGQLDDATAGRGSVKVALSGIPSGRTVASVTVSDPIGSTWAWSANSSKYTDPTAVPLTFRLSSTDATKADLLFQPNRDESNSNLTARVVLEDGSQYAVSFAGGSVDFTKRAPLPVATSIVAKPGDDLNALANNYGTVILSAGTYNLSQPLILNRPVTITSNGGATLLFTQSSGSAAWSTAIKVMAGNTTLDNFSVRFSGPINWRTDVSYGAAVIGTTDNTDPANSNLLVGINVTRLNVQGPPASSSWEEAVRLMRLVSAQSGKISGNTLKGGPTEFFGGPWNITNNTYLGTMPNTYSYNVFAGHATHDLNLSGNTVTPDLNVGKTWRFLVMTYGGSNDVIQGNSIQGIGPIDGDGVPNVNANEIILTESYSLKFEGLPSSVTADGRIVQISAPQGDSPRAGDAVAILSGTGAGQYRRILQVLSPTAFLLDAPLPSGSGAISIAQGFVGETFQGNTIDAHTSTTAYDLVLAGDNYGTKIVGNTIIGGGTPIRLEAAPTERPIMWGWSHAPFMGVSVTGNTIQDGWNGSNIVVDSGTPVKSSVDRTYFSGDVSNNTFVWTQNFFTKRLNAGLTSTTTNLTLDGGTALGLNVTFNGNLVQEPAGYSPSLSITVTGATVNGVFQNSTKIALPTTPPPAPSIIGLVNDSGVSSTDKITNDSRIQLGPLTGSATGAEYRLSGSSTYTTIPAAGLFTPAGLVQGSNTVNVRTFDVTQNHSPDVAFSLVYDTQAPVVQPPALQTASDSGRSNSDGITNVTNPSFNMTSNEPGNFTLLRNGLAVAQGTNVTALTDPGLVPDGSQFYAVKEADIAGNVTQTGFSVVTVQTMAPAQPTSVTVSTDAKLNFVSSGSTYYYEYKLNADAGYTQLGTATSASLTGMVSGANKVYVHTVNVAGNVSADVAVTFSYTPVNVSTVTYLGQDNHDYTGLQSSFGPDGLQDMHFVLQNLPQGRSIVSLQVRGVGGGIWTSNPGGGVWPVAVYQTPGTTKADVYFQPYAQASNRTYYLNITFDNGQSLLLVASRVTANPKLQVTKPGAPNPQGSLAPLTGRGAQLKLGKQKTHAQPVVGHTWSRKNLASHGHAKVAKTPTEVRAVPNLKAKSRKS